jgi:hypothetical protein
MKRSIAQLMISAAAVVLFGATASLHAQDIDRVTVPMAFSIGSTTYAADTYDLKLPVNTARPFTISRLDGKLTNFALTGAAMQHTDKTRARGPVLILKCAYNGCYVTEIWTDVQGFAINHPRSIDEKLASTTQVLALTRVISH